MEKPITTRFDVQCPDHWQGAQGVGIYFSADGLFKTFAEAKASLIESIDTQIWELKQLKKEIRSQKQGDVKA